MSRDIRASLRGNESAYPFEDEDQAVAYDPYGTEEVPVRAPLPIPVPTPQRILEPTAKPIVRRRIPQLEEPLEQPEPARSSADNPFRRLVEDWEEDEQRAPAEPASDLVVVPVEAIVPVDALALPEEAPAEPLAIAKVVKIAEEANKSVQDICNTYKQRISSGVTATIQAGPRSRLLQELFGTPDGVDIRGAVIAKKPVSTNPPEPLISRRSAPLLKEVFQTKDKEPWSQTAWQKFSTTFYGRIKPGWVIYLYGSEKAKDPAVINPYQELADLQQDALQPLRTLPSFLNAITNGTAEERAALILSLHKRLYHRESGQLKKMLYQAGVPLHLLAFVDDVVNSCETCRAFANTSAKPPAKLSTAGCFNAVVYYDLVFFDSVILFVGVDECTRYCIIAVAEYKSYDSLESCFRRNWLRHFGAPAVFRSDKESAFNSDKFAVYLSSIGCKLELVTAKEQHTWLGILDRRIQLIRRMFPKLLRDLSDEHLFIEYEDVAAECQIAVNTCLTLGGVSSYQMLYGASPGPIFDEDQEFVFPVEAHNVFYEHQIIRAKAIACFHEALIDERIQRNLSGRSRTAVAQNYIPGMSVDFYRKSERKQLEGWRGPATILALTVEGYVTLRWQSHNLDIPVNHIRPHLDVFPRPALPAPALAAVVPALPAVPAAPNPPADLPVLLSAEELPGGAALVLWEEYWFSEGLDQIPDA